MKATMTGAKEMDKGGNFELEMELVFHNEPYFFTMTVTPADHLCVEVEQKNSGLLWRGDFTARYIEGITQKTGSFKKFTVFVSMLRSAILQESESVFVELLSYQDLEMLKHRRSPEPGQTPLIANNKRYLILTYDGEFDRVHYPLPLLFEEHPDAESLKRTVKRQRAEIAHLKAQLRSRVNFAPTHGHTGCPNCADGLQSHSKHADRLNEDKQKLARDLATYKKKCQLLISELQEKKLHARDMQVMRKRMEELQQEFKAERMHQKHSVLLITKEKMALQDEVKIARISERRLRGQIRDMEHAVDILRKQLRADADSPASSASRRPDWVSSLNGGSRPRSPHHSTRSTSPHPGDWGSSAASSARNSRRPSPYASRLQNHSLHPGRSFNPKRSYERSRSAFPSRNTTPRTAKMMPERAKSASSTRSHTPRGRNMGSEARTISPRSGTSPRERDNAFRYTSPPHLVQRYLPHSAGSSRQTSAFSTRENSPRGVSSARNTSRGASPYDAYLAANAMASAAASARPSSTESAFRTGHAQPFSNARPLSRDSLSPRARTPSERPLQGSQAGRVPIRIPPRPDSRDVPDAMQGQRTALTEPRNLTSMSPRKLAEYVKTTQSAETHGRDAKAAALSPRPRQRSPDIKQAAPAPSNDPNSPRKVLQEVEERLATFAKKEKEGVSKFNEIFHANIPAVPVPEEEQMGMELPEQKLPSNHVTRGTAGLDVDSRLHALQNFLQAAKASMKDEGYDFIV